ncbi:hypothetical protein ACFPMF_02720 [Larkinella bovis]|uniref:Glycosyltransferase RgtA/B/C/D-like domain-containing protein n=1 Tax=Larkinella bovis TaxID=683041 RepID=A0ABW0I7W3_9BACT
MPIFRRTITLVLLLIPVVFVGLVVLKYAIDLPYWDDYIVQNHLISLKSDTGIFRKVGRLFDQHWEHRIVWTRIVFFLFYKLNGELNYYGLTLIGVSGLFLLLGLLFAVFRKSALPLHYFLPVPFWLITLQSHENLIWAMASIQNFYILLFALGAFYLLAYPSRQAYALALVLAAMACFTSGNGFLVFLIGTFLLVWQKLFRRALGWLVVGLGCLLAFFLTYNRVTFFPSPYLYGFGEWFKAFFVFVGAFVDTYPYTKPLSIGYENPVWLTILVGAGVVGFAVWHLVVLLLQNFPFSRRPQFSPIWFWPVFFAGSLLFLLATDAMTVYSRVGFGGAGYLLQGRYKVYSGLFFSITYLYALRLYSGKKALRYSWLVLFLTAAPLSLYADYQCLEGIINQRRKTVAAYLTWRLQTPEKDRNHFESVYHPTPFLDSYIRVLTTPPGDTAVRFDSLTEEPFFLNVIKTDAINPSLQRPEEGSYIVLVGADSNYVYAARPLRPYSLPDSGAKSGKNDYFSSAFQAQVSKELTRSGTYRLGVLVNRNDSLRFQMSPVVFQHTTPY